LDLALFEERNRLLRGGEKCEFELEIVQAGGAIAKLRIEADPQFDRKRQYMGSFVIIGVFIDLAAFLGIAETEVAVPTSGIDQRDAEAPYFELFGLALKISLYQWSKVAESYALGPAMVSSSPEQESADRITTRQNEVIRKGLAFIILPSSSAARLPKCGRSVCDPEAEESRTDPWLEGLPSLIYAFLSLSLGRPRRPSHEG